MSPAAIRQRLETMANLQRQRGFVAKGVDMSPLAITQRLKMQSALTDLCLRLGRTTIVKP